MRRGEEVERRPAAADAPRGTATEGTSLRRPRDGRGDQRPLQTAAGVWRHGQAARRGWGVEAHRRERGRPCADGHRGTSLQTSVRGGGSVARRGKWVGSVGRMLPWRSCREEGDRSSDCRPAIAAMVCCLAAVGRRCNKQRGGRSTVAAAAGRPRQFSPRKDSRAGMSPRRSDGEGGAAPAIVTPHGWPRGCVASDEGSGGGAEARCRGRGTAAEISTRSRPPDRRDDGSGRGKASVTVEPAGTPDARGGGGAYARDVATANEDVSWGGGAGDVGADGSAGGGGSRRGWAPPRTMPRDGHAVCRLRGRGSPDGHWGQPPQTRLGDWQRGRPRADVDVDEAP